MRLNLSNPITPLAPRRVPNTRPNRPKMLKTFSLSVLFFLTLGVMFAAYASVPVPV
jgi:hypothetical protein